MVLGMARLARVVIPGLPHHVTQRGNRREAIFFEDGDREVYLDLAGGHDLKKGFIRSRVPPGPSLLGTGEGQPGCRQRIHSGDCQPVC